MLWGLIRDFFVIHVFGGIATDGLFYDSTIGDFDYYVNGELLGNETIGTSTKLFHLTTTADGYEYYVSLGDYLSTIATIISISIIVILCCLFVYKIIKLVGNLIR